MPLRPTQADDAAQPLLPAKVDSPTPPGTANRRWRSAELFGGEREIEIEHGQAVYRLRRTALGKLILIK